MLKKTIMAYVHQLLDQPSQWQTSQQAGPCSVPKFTSTSITVKHLLIKNQNINQSKSSLLIWHYVSYLFLFNTAVLFLFLFIENMSWQRSLRGSPRGLVVKDANVEHSESLVICGFGHMWGKPSSACGWPGGFSLGSPIFVPPYDWLGSKWVK